MSSGTMRPSAAPKLGPFVLVELLGEGGMAEVWRADWHGAAGFVRPVALKLMRSSFLEDHELVDLFVAEAKLSARLAHPNIVTTLAFGCVASRYYMAMELVDGVPLHVLLKARPEGLTTPLAVHVALCMARALEHAWGAPGEDGHPLEIVHRDVNPANVLVSVHGEVKLADFGIAKARDVAARTATGALRGKLAYMSPEQARSERLDARSDLYALGLTFYEMLTGQRAIAAREEHKVLELARDGVVKALPPRIPDPLRRIVEWLTVARIEDRCPSARELVHALEAYASTLPPVRAQAEFRTLIAELPSTPRLAPLLVVARTPDQGGVDRTEAGTVAGRMRSGEAARSPAEPGPKRRGALLASALAVAVGALVAAGQYVRSASNVARPTDAPSSRGARSTAVVEADLPVEAPRHIVAAPSDSSDLHDADRRSRRTTPAAVGRPATLRIQVTPWGTVHVDGKSLGDTPLGPVEVPPGAHVVRVSNPGWSDKRVTVKVAAGENRFVDVRFPESSSKR